MSQNYQFPSNLKVAIVHDQLNQAGGAERVLFAIAKLFPKAPIYTLIYDKKRLKGFEQIKIKTSLIQNLPFGKSHFKWYLPLMPTAVENLDLSGYDLVISSSSALIKGVITGPKTVHISYCHTPTRWLWSEAGDYVEDLNVNKFVKKILPLFLTKLRTWDQLAAQRVDHYIANSKFVADRIKNYYRRDAEVIYPPVDTENYQISKEVGDYYLMTGRLRPYKKFDLAIKAFNKLGRKLKIIGTGEQYEQLKAMAKGNIEFVGNADEQTKRELLSKCIAFINPQVEDFGITAVEALASGRPVIAYKDGGACEQIIEGVNGEFMEDQTWECLVDLILHFDHTKFNPETIKQSAEKYNWKIFHQHLADFVKSKIS